MLRAIIRNCVVETPPIAGKVIRKYRIVDTVEVLCPQFWKSRALLYGRNNKDACMQKIRDYRPPGFYTDEHGAYGIVLGGVYINCFINNNGSYGVTADAITELRCFVLQYAPK